jgi:hypothetical protein
VWGEHADFGSGVFSHEIMIIGIVEFVRLLLGPSIVLCNFPFFFLLRHCFVNIIGVHFILSSIFVQIILRLLKDIIVLNGLLIEHIINVFFKLILSF